MKAAVFKGKGRIEIVERPYPKIIEPSDAIVRVLMTTVCGSDLWYYRGISPYPENTPIGHEFIGIVEKVGSEVKSIVEGDLVIAPFFFCDNTCPHCKAGVTSSCINAGVWGIDSDGAQGEAVRVPFADGTLVKTPKSNYPKEKLAALLTLTDVMCTGHYAAKCANVKEGNIVAVVGDGAVGLCAIIASKRLGASRIILVGSRNEARQKVAKELGATDIIPERGEVAIKKVMELTNGIGVDSALECVGTNEAMQMAIAIARPGSIVGFVGVPHGVEISVNSLFFKNLGIRGGPAPVRALIPELLDDVLNDKIKPNKVLDYETKLEGIPEAYALMDQRKIIKPLVIVK